MAYFTSPCSGTDKLNVTPMPTLIKSIYQESYVPPKYQQKIILKESVEKALPIDYLPIDSGKRILPTTFYDVHRHSISASISEMVDLKFQDNTPQWKLDKRKPIERNWLRPLSDRRDFIKTQQWYLRKMKRGRQNNKKIPLMDQSDDLNGDLINDDHDGDDEFYQFYC